MEERDVLAALGYDIDDDEYVSTYKRSEKDGIFYCTLSYRIETIHESK